MAFRTLKTKLDEPGNPVDFAITSSLITGMFTRADTKFFKKHTPIGV